MKTNSVLVQTETSDNLRLSGLYRAGNKSKPVVIFIHGFISDFYSHVFPHLIQSKLEPENFASISIQTRGSGIQTEFLPSGEIFGSYLEKIEDSHLDISAWIDFLKAEGYSEFILAGHSLGTIKSVRYLFEGEYKNLISKLILLAPFDKNGYIENFTKGRWIDHLKIAEQKIRNGDELESVPEEFDESKFSFRTYYSWYQKTDLNLIWDFYRTDYISPVLSKIELPVSVIVGDQDEFFYTESLGGSVENSLEYLKRNIKNSEINLIKGAGHTYVGFEDEVANGLIEFINY